MRKFRVHIEQWVEVEIDESKFDDEFMQEFRDAYFQFHSIEQHVEHLAQLCARGIVAEGVDVFIEGYGSSKEMGIRCQIPSTEVDGCEELKKPGD